MKKILLVIIFLAGCYGNPMPDIPQGNNCSTKKVLFLGDSLMDQSGQAIINKLHNKGYPVNAKVVAHPASSVVEYAPSFFTEFLPPEGFANPRVEAQYYIDTFDPDIVVADWGIVPPWSLWFSEYGFLIPWAVQSGMEEIKAMTINSGATLYWTTLPPINTPDDWYVGGVDGWIRQLGVDLIDWRAALTNELGGYETFLKYPEDDMVRPVRTEDGVHLTPEGIDRVATWAASKLRPC